MTSVSFEPRFAELPDAAGHLRRLRAGGVGLALEDYVPGGPQDALVPPADFVKVDLRRGPDFAARAIGRAREGRVAVTAEHVDGEAAAAQLKIAPAGLVERTRVSHDVGDALLTLSGPYGPVLAAVLAHEENDIAGVEATGLSVHDVAHAYLDAVAQALGTATALANPGR